MERKAASQQSELTVRRPTIVHSLDSCYQNIPSISGIDFEDLIQQKRYALTITLAEQWTIRFRQAKSAGKPHGNDPTANTRRR